ncbi:MAG: putative glycoside hydrolase [Elusimicrobia bacterium]|nr:putative glycoside hydrolase [Elusimicrobiota bacterium]
MHVLSLVLALSLPAAAESTAPVRGVHLTAWVAGSGKDRRAFLDKASGTLVNAVVVPVKEYDGRVYIPGVASAQSMGTARHAIPDPKGLVADIKARGLRPVARVVVFKDDTLARKRPEWAVQDSSGGIWTNMNGVAWVDPYRKEVWDYNIEVAVAAARAGFEEIQFDYIRFPSDGAISRCRYSVAHTTSGAGAALSAFFERARQHLDREGVAMSAAVFGLTTTARDDMGIGQKLAKMTALLDAVSPMMYPSHYAKGEYGLADPNAEPYKIISWGLRDAKRKLGGVEKLRPYLQDFSLGRRYGVFEVRAQLRAARRQGVESWILWNPLNRYTWEALKPFTEAELVPVPGEDEPPAKRAPRGRSMPAKLSDQPAVSSGTVSIPAAAPPLPTDSELKALQEPEEL